jgi:hypothetical protein
MRPSLFAFSARLPVYPLTRFARVLASQLAQIEWSSGD